MPTTNLRGQNNDAHKEERIIKLSQHESNLPYKEVMTTVAEIASILKIGDIIVPRWQMINRFIDVLIQISKKTGQPVKWKFNEVFIVADKDATAEILIERYNRTIDKRHREDKEKNKEEMEELQQQCDEIVKKLETLNFDDYGTILDWLYIYQKFSNTIGIKKQKKIVLNIFWEHWFKNKRISEKEYNLYDKVGFARYIIEGSLNDLSRVNFIPPMKLDLIEMWRKEGKIIREEDKDEIIIEARSGDRIDRFARLLIKEHQETGKIIKGIFSWVNLIANKDSTIDSIIQQSKDKINKK